MREEEKGRGKEKRGKRESEEGEVGRVKSEEG